MPFKPIPGALPQSIYPDFSYSLLMPAFLTSYVVKGHKLFAKSVQPEAYCDTSRIELREPTLRQ